MPDQKNVDWIENYGFILVAFAHMTDWCLADAEIDVINEKMKLMISQSNREYSEEDVAQKLIKILQRYEALKDGEGKEMMEHLLIACEALKKELWFDKYSATVVVEFLAEIAEADHKIEETEAQFLKNIADFFGAKAPNI